MLWAVTGITFVLTVMVVAALVYAFSRSETEVAGRLPQVMAPPTMVREERFSEKQKERAKEALASLGKLMPAATGAKASRGQLMMIRAGFRSPDAMLVIRGVKVLLPIALAGVVYVTGLYRYSPLFMLIAAAVAGLVLPEIWLQARISARKRRLRRGLPDALDLLVICVEVGLGLDQAIMRVAQELHLVHPDLSEELQKVNLEMRVGKSRTESLRELARRTGLEDLKSLVAMLIQTDRFGTSVAQSLRVFSDELRTKRRQRAEEMSAKTSVKMVGPLVFLIFPALMVVILGPAVITVMRQLLPALK